MKEPRRRRKKAVTRCEKKDRRVDVRDHPAFGMWKERKDLEDVAGAVRRLRKPRQDPGHKR